MNWVEFYGEALQTTLDIRSGPSSQQKFYDLVSWDPRGINDTVPFSSGISDPAVLGQFTQMLTDFGYSLDNDDVFNELWALNKLYGELVSKNGDLGQAGHVGQYVGTASVARDMVEMVERYGEWRANEAKELLQGAPLDDAAVEAILQRTAWQKGYEKIQYWGFSYGTILGQTFATLYPERIGRFALDGVANITDYYTGAWKGAFHSDEDINANFTAACAQAGPSTCVMANWVANSSSSQSDQPTALLTSLSTHLESCKSNPITGLFDAAQTPILVTGSDAMRNLFTLYYNGWAGYRIASRVLYELSQGNATWFHLTTGPPFACPVPSSFKDYSAAAVAIECVDADDKTSLTKEDWQAYIRELRDITPTFFGYGATVAMPCTGYRLRAKWRYAGPFGATAQRLGNPILFVSQTLDPICPLVAAEDGAGRFEGSGLVEAQGVGHTSFGWPNACALAEIRKYFATGKVSAERVLCPASVVPFETDVQAQGRLNGTQLDETERELLSVALEVGRTWPELNTGGY